MLRHIVDHVRLQSIVNLHGTLCFAVDNHASLSTCCDGTK
jgi:hypothetical protein